VAAPRRLGDLVAGLPASETGSSSLGLVSSEARAVEVSGLAYDSRRVEPGDLFVVWSGARHPGSRFAAEAVGRGAVAVLTGAPPSAQERSAAGDVPWLVAADPRRLLGPIASRLYGAPDRELLMAGVTGTNGKTTTTALLGRILDAAGKPAGVMGTLGYRFGDQTFEGERTTPEASDLFRVLRAMRERGAAAVAMEVSSHALAQGRVAGVAFDLAVFTNLTRDHLDFHATFGEYFAAKRKLFDQLKPGGAAAVNADDPWGRQLLLELPAAVGFGIADATAAVRAVDVELDADGVRGLLSTPAGETPFASPLLGRFNLANLLAAAAGAHALGLGLDAIAAGIAAQPPLSGRFEPVRAGQPFPVLVDYAHTDDALGAAIRATREFTRRKVAVVFGCGGDRDPGKRPLMGRAVGALADLPIATSDNPRTEDPLAILAAVERGLKESGNDSYRIVPDRREAIRGAIATGCGAPDDWAVLIAGKGHETYQIVGDRQLPFSDRDEVEKAIADRQRSGAC
jgi:UDP-N-acetylmuramoyl-L-alanyl-D-glutamate--2,6-diaminopimelate ligase